MTKVDPIIELHPWLALAPGQALLEWEQSQMDKLVADVFDPLYYRTTPEKNPPGPSVPAWLPADTSEGRVTRGLWFDREPLNWPAEQIAPAWARSDVSIAAGFRCARGLPQAGVISKYHAIAWRKLP